MQFSYLASNAFGAAKPATGFGAAAPSGGGLFGSNTQVIIQFIPMMVFFIA